MRFAASITIKVRMFRGIILVFLLVLLAISARAEQGGCLERTIPVSIVSNDGSAAPELSAANLGGTYNNQPVIVKSVEVEKTPPRVILLVDTSGSMERRSGAAIDVAEGVLSKLPSNVEVGLAFFAVDTIPVVLPTLDRKILIFELEALRRNPKSYRGKTALWSALIDSVKMFKESRPGDSIYLISDAGENKSMANRRSVERAIGTAGVRFFAFIISPGIRAATVEELNGPSDVRRIAESTGGTTIATLESPSGPFPSLERVVLTGKDGKPTELGETVSRQVDQISRFYRVEISLPESADKPRGWTLRLAKSANSLKGKFRLTYPATLWPCS